MVFICVCFFFFKQKTAYEMRISDWSSDVCSSDLEQPAATKLERAAMQLTVETNVRAPIERVWEAYTTPDEIIRWNAASDDWHTTRAIVEECMRRSEERRVGKEWVRTCRSGGWVEH